MCAGFPGQDCGDEGEGGEAAAPDQALRMESEVGFDERWVKRESEQRGEIGERVETPGNAARLNAGQPHLEQRTGCAEHEEWKADGDAEREEDGGDGMGRVQADGLNGPGDGGGGGKQQEGEVEVPMRAPGEPMRVEIGEEKGGLKEDETGDPDCGGSAEGGQELLGSDGLDQEEKERAEKDGAAEERSRTASSGNS